MTHVLLSFGYLISLYLSNQGIVFGTNMLLALIGIHITLFVISTSVLFTVFSGDIEIRGMKVKSSDISFNFLILAFVGIGTYHLFQIEYKFISGMALTTVLVGVFSNLSRLILRGKEIDEED